MSAIEGVIERVNKRGAAVNVCIDGVWYGLGFEEVPPVSEGDTIKFNAVAKGKYMNAEKDSVEVVAKGEAKPATSSRSGGSSREDYWENKEKRDVQVQAEIRWQASRNSATEVLKVAFEQDALSLPTKKADKYDALLVYLDSLTERFFVQTKEIAGE